MATPTTTTTTKKKKKPGDFMLPSVPQNVKDKLVGTPEKVTVENQPQKMLPPKAPTELADFQKKETPDIYMVEPKKLKFDWKNNPDRTKSVSFGGKTFTLNAEEEKLFNGGEGTMTPNAKQAIDYLNQTRAEHIDLNNKIDAANAIAVGNKVLEDEAVRMGLEKIAPVENIDKMAADLMNTEQGITRPNSQTKIEQIEGRTDLTQIEKNIGTSWERTKGTVANGVDWVKTLITNKKPLKQQLAEDSFNNLKDSIDNEIKLVGEGVIDARLVREDILNTYVAINQLESYQKSIWSENYRNWVDDGLNVQTQINQMKRTLQIYLYELQAAQQRARLSYAAGNIGQ